MSQNRKNSIFLILSMVPLLACASWSFHYRFYGMELVRYEGKLLASEPSEDLDVKVCEPDEQEKGKCIVMLRKEFYKMKGDFEKLAKELENCRNGIGCE